MSVTVLTPASSRLLATRDQAKAEMEITGTADDAVIDGFLRQASDTIAAHCRRTLVLETVTETVNSTYGLRRSVVHTPIWLDRYPVASISSITSDGVAVPADDYSLDAETGRLERLTVGYLCNWWGRVVVSYSGGYAPGQIPGDIERACLDLVKRSYFGRSRDPALRSERILDVIDSGYTAVGSEPLEDGIPADIAGRLRRYRRIA